MQASEIIEKYKDQIIKVVPLDGDKTPKAPQEATITLETPTEDGEPSVKEAQLEPLKLAKMRDIFNIDSEQEIGERMRQMLLYIYDNTKGQGKSIREIEYKVGEKDNTDDKINAVYNWLKTYRDYKLMKKKLQLDEA